MLFTQRQRPYNKMTLATTQEISNSLAGASAVIAEAESQAGPGSLVTVTLGREVLEGNVRPAYLWVLGPARVQLTGWGNYLDLPLRYQYAPGFGRSRLVTRDEAVALVMLSFAPAVELLPS